MSESFFPSANISRLPDLSESSYPNVPLDSSKSGASRRGFRSFAQSTLPILLHAPLERGSCRFMHTSRQNSNGIEFAVSRLSLGMKWICLCVVR